MKIKRETILCILAFLLAAAHFYNAFEERSLISVATSIVMFFIGLHFLLGRFRKDP